MSRMISFIAGVTFLFALLVAAVKCGPIPSAQAQPMPRCGTPQDMTARLAEQFGERRDGVGQISDGLEPDARVLELFVSGSGSWTILVTTQDQRTCMFASGERWQGRGWQEARQ